MNKTMTIDELYNVLCQTRIGFAPTWNNAWGGSTIGFLYGHKIVLPRFSDKVVLFSFCEYCGSTYVGANDLCMSCGAPAYL